MKDSVNLSNFLSQRPDLVKKINKQINRLKNQLNELQWKEKMKILQQRLELIEGVKEYNDTRINNLQKILKHYSTNAFKPGQKYDFDQIKYINEHLNLDKFFAFIKDFNLNQIIINGETKNLASQTQIALLFKKGSPNSKNINIAQFIALLEKLFVFLYDQTKDYTKKQRQMSLQKQKIRQQAKKRQLIKKEKVKAKILKIQPKSRQIAPVSEKKKDKGKQKEKEKPSVKQNIAKPTKNAKYAAHKQQIKSFIQQKQKVNPDPELQDIYNLTNEEKVQLYMLKIDIDNRKVIQRKLRFLSGEYRQGEIQELFKIQQFKRKIQKNTAQLIQIQDKWKNQRREPKHNNADKFEDALEKIDLRSLAKSKSNLSQSQSNGINQLKQRNFVRKNKSMIKSLIFRKQQDNENLIENAQYNLQMINKSTPNQLPISKIIPEKYLSQDPTDEIYMKQFQLSPPYRNRKISKSRNIFMIQQTKRRVHELQTQQTNHYNRVINNLSANRHYMSKFLYRKW